MKIGVPFYCYDKDYELEDLEDGALNEVTIRTNQKNCYIDLDDGTRLYGLYPDLPKISRDERDVLHDMLDEHPSTDLAEYIKQFSSRSAITVYLSETYVSHISPQVIFLYFDTDTIQIPDNRKIQTETTAVIQKNLKEKEDKTNMMDNMLNKMRFGKAGKDYSLTMFGTIAFKNKTYINGEIQEVEGMTIPFDMIFAVPTQVIQAGDLIERDVNNVIYITKVEDNGAYKGISLTSGTVIDYVPKTYFGLKMYTKIVNPLAGGFNFGANTNNSLNGNTMVNMLMMQSLLGNDNSCGNSNDNKMLMMMMLMGGNNSFMNMFNLNGAAVNNNESKK